MLNINFFDTKFRTPTVQTIFWFLKEAKAFLRRTKIFNGDMFFRNPSERDIRRCKRRKNEKVLFCVGRADLALRARQGEIFKESASRHLVENCVFALLMRSFRLILSQGFDLRPHKAILWSFRQTQISLLFTVVSKHRLDNHTSDRFSKQKHF